MKIPNQKQRGRQIALASCLFFLLAGQAFIPRLGIEDDEALFAMPLFAPRYWEYALQFGQSHIALMIMSYIGTLKTLVWKTLVRNLGGGVWVTREPAIVAGAVSVWLFYLLMRRLCGERAAALGAVLLATDSLYLMTTCFDWGPVALQHLLIGAGMLLLVRFYQERREWMLAAGCFAFGLAVWDKALALWMLSGLGLAALAVAGRAIWKLCTARRLAIAALAFVLGVLPLIVYNAATDWKTFRGNVKRDTSELPQKVLILENTITGQGLFGYLTDDDRKPQIPHEPSGTLETASAALSEADGHRRLNLMLYGLGLALLLAPMLRGAELRLFLFSLIAMAVAWVQMALNAATGGSVHHTILLWPLPYLTIAVPLAAASRRLGRVGLPVLVAIGTLLAGSSLLVTNEYYAQMVAHGGAIGWTDAIFTLNDYLKGTKARYVICVDWGMIDTLRLLGHGRIPLREGGDPLGNLQLTDTEKQTVQKMAGEPDVIFVGHTEDNEVVRGNLAKLTALAKDAGLDRAPLATLADSYGRPTFEIFRFVKNGQ